MKAHMIPRCLHAFCFVFLFAIFAATVTQAQTPDTITFQSGNLKLKGLLWKPAGPGPFPAVMYNHGSEARPERFLAKTPAAFVERGYIFFAPFRRGQGLSADQGKYIVTQLDSASFAGGPAARFALVIKLHETTQLQDQMAALQFLSSHPGVDANRLALVGISFGGIQTMLMASKPTNLKAALNFAGAAMMWEKSTEVAEWMKQVAAKARIPVYFIQAENDFSIKPSIELSEQMKKNSKPYLVKIYPPRGTTPMEGHTLIDAVDIWGPDIFPQLNKWLDRN